MERKCIKFDLKELRKDTAFQDGMFYNIEIYIDGEQYNEILSFIEAEENIKKFRRIMYEVLHNRYSDDLYQKIEPGLAEMRFKRKKQNSRIYCREINQDGKKIIMVHLVPHKDFDRTGNKTIKGKIAVIKTYIYEFTG